MSTVLSTQLPATSQPTTTSNLPSNSKRTQDLYLSGNDLGRNNEEERNIRRRLGVSKFDILLHVVNQELEDIEMKDSSRNNQGDYRNEVIYYDQADELSGISAGRDFLDSLGGSTQEVSWKFPILSNTHSIHQAKNEIR